jgi:hypothetical protein
LRSRVLDGVSMNDIFVNISRNGNRTITVKRPDGTLFAKIIYANRMNNLEDLALWHDIGVLMDRKERVKA